MKLQIRDESGPLVEAIVQKGTIVRPATSIRTRSVTVNDIAKLKVVLVYDETDLNVVAGKNKIGDERIITNAMMGQEGMPAWGAQEGAAGYKIDKDNGVLFTGAGIARVILVWPFLDPQGRLASIMLPAQFAVAATAGGPVPTNAPGLVTPAVVTAVKPETKPIEDVKQDLLTKVSGTKSVILIGGAVVLLGLGIWLARRAGSGRKVAMAGAVSSPATRIRRLRKIVEERQAGKVDGRMVDGYTASAIIQVYDHLSPANQARYASVPVTRMADIAWKLVK
jgi:hypothetical protein